MLIIFVGYLTKFVGCLGDTRSVTGELEGNLKEAAIVS
jgi:hypothetical protein